MADSEKTYKLTLCRWQGKLHCVYLNDYRIAGGKPWAGGTVEREWNVTIDDLIRAIPELREFVAVSRG